MEDSWRARSNLTFNVGLRWDLIRPWSEKYNNIQTIVPGEQSVLYPNAIPGLVVPGDPGIPSTLSPTKYRSFAPRIGVAYSPIFSKGILKTLFGDSGKKQHPRQLWNLLHGVSRPDRGNHVWRSALSDITI